MAKKRKPLSKRKQAELLRKQGYSYREINRMKQDTRQTISGLIITDKREKQKEKTPTKPAPKTDKDKRKLDRQKRITQKRFYLDKIGFHGALERGKYSDRLIDSIKLKDMELGRVNRENYPWLSVPSTFDFNQIYQLKDNKRMYFAFRDYQGELDIESELARFSKYNDGALLDGLESIVNTPPSYQKGVAGSSSGRAGDFKFITAQQKVIEVFSKQTNRDTAKDKRLYKNQTAEGRKRKRGHFKGDKVGYQVIKNGSRNSFSEVTPHNLLVMANAIMYNITENDRTAFYKRFYTDVIEHIPEMVDILPAPKF